MQHSNRLDAAQVAQFAPEVIARAVSLFSRDSVGGDWEAHLTREALIDAWMVHKGFSDRAQAISDLVGIEIAARGGRT